MRVLASFTIDDTYFEVPLDCWPAIPRIGDLLRVRGNGADWIGTVDEVTWHMTDESGPLVWCGTSDARVATEDDP